MSLPAIDTLVIDWLGTDDDIETAERTVADAAGSGWRLRGHERHRGFFRILLDAVSEAVREAGEAFGRLHRIVRAMGESVRAGLVWAIERIQPSTDGPENKRWPLEYVGLTAPYPSAAGIRVAHLDTGYLPHAEVEGAFDMSLAHDFVDGHLPPDADGTSLLGGVFEHHGTRTGALLGSRGTGRLRGSAGDATIIPMRVTQDPILWTDLEYEILAKAIHAACDARADVISMSLGGLWPSRCLDAAIDRAVDAGIIVVAAAGQPMARVTHPGAHPGVITAAAVNDQHKAPRWSARGPEVDVAAPGEDVWVPKPSGGVQRSWGTSYATVLTAGAAALWRATHAAALAQHARSDIGPAFARALRQAGFAEVVGSNKKDFGAGILNVPKLLAVAPSTAAEKKTTKLNAITLATRDPALHAALRGLSRIPDLDASLRADAQSWSTLIAARPLAPPETARLFAQELAFLEAFDPPSRAAVGAALVQGHLRLGEVVAHAFPRVRREPGLRPRIPGASAELNAWLTG